MATLQTLHDWQNQIMSGMFRNKPYVRPNGMTAYHSETASDAAWRYDFDKRAKSMNNAYHPARPATEVKRDTSDTSHGNRTQLIPLNAAVRDIYDMVTNFDVSRLPDYDNMPAAFCGHLIFTRPSLYINVNSNTQGYSPGTPSWTTNAECNYYHFATEPLVAGFASDELGRVLLHPLTMFSSNPYMPLFTSKALTYQTVDVGLKTIEKGQTFYGHTIKYGHYNEDHKAGGTITIDFLNDKFWSVLQTCYMWMAYIYMVSKTNVVRPSIACQTNGILDYAGSLYYLVTDMMNHKLIYWEKLTGIFPKLVPFSLFSTEDNPKIEDKVSIEFDYGIRSDPKDPNVLLDINMLTYGNIYSAQTALRTLSVDPFSGRIDPLITRADSFAGGVIGRSNVEAARPVIRSEKVGIAREYYLEWLIQNPSAGVYETY